MRDSFFIVFVMLFCLQGTGQIRTDSFLSYMSEHKDLKEEELERFKQTETMFILPGWLTKEEYQKILDEVWDITPFKIYMASSLKGNEVQIGNSIVEYQGSGVTTTKVGASLPSSSSLVNYLKFGIVNEIKPATKKRGIRFVCNYLGAIYFTANAEMLNSVFFGVGKELEGGLINTKYIYLKNFIAEVNNNLKLGRSVSYMEDYSFPELKNLGNKTLYIDLNLFSERGLDEGYDMKKYVTKKLKKYPYKYEILPYEDFEKVVLDSEEGVYYFMINHLNSYKVISVINSKTSKIIYQQVSKLSYALKAKDFVKLAEAIEKSAQE